MGPLRVLSVEDSDNDTALITYELRRAGFEVIHERVETAEAMRAALTATPWDVILSDWTMPKFSAHAALAVLTDSGLDIPFVIVSGTVGEEVAVEALRAGANDLVLKSRLPRLAPVIERAMRERETRAKHRRAEHALRESETRYRRIVETTNQGIWTMDAEGRITFANHRMAEFLGLPLEDILGRPALAFIAEDERAAVAQRIEMRKAGLRGMFPATVVRADGQLMPVDIESTPILDDAGGYEGLLGLATDVTERGRAEEALRSTEEQLRQAQKMEAIGILAGGVAHDFNNLLSVILSYTAMALDELPDDSALRADLAEVHKAGERAAGLTRQLLAFSRRQVLQPTVLDLNEVLTGMGALLRRLIGEDIELRMNLGAGVARVKFDRGQIEQVVMNLAVNARDAMPRGGKLTIDTQLVDLDERYVSEHVGATPGPHVVLAVTDTGSGMTKGILDRIFDPFFTTKDKDRGTGLGLSTVLGIVQQSGGTIWVDSAPGAGTTFRIYLAPVTDHVEDSGDRPIAGETTLRGTETILLVEDDQALRALIHTILRRHGYQVLEADSAGDALLICEQHPARIDLLLTDVVMPRISGRELAGRIEQVRPALRVLYMSGYTDDAVLHHGVLDSDVAFLQKPITPDVLVRRVRETLDARPRRRRAAAPLSRG